MYNTKTRLENYMEICDLHAESLLFTTQEITTYKLSKAEDFGKLTPSQKNTLDSFIMRFGQLQDTIGTRIFPSLLPLITENSQELATVIDRLNKLEKLEYIPSTHWWTKLRDLRNASSHDYPNNNEAQLTYYNEIKTSVPELLDFWKILRQKITVVISKYNKQ